MLCCCCVFGGIFFKFIVFDWNCVVIFFFFCFGLKEKFENGDYCLCCGICMLFFCVEVKFFSLGFVFMVVVLFIIVCVFFTCGGWYFVDDDLVFENVEVVEI